MATPPFADFKRRLIIVGSLGLLIIIAGAVTAYFVLDAGRVYIDTATISAPTITLAPTAGGTLDALYVQEGDMVSADEPVAEVGDQVLTARVPGLVVKVSDTVGAQITPGEAVVTMIDPSQLRVVGSLDENKGLAQVALGDPVIFTVDAFGSQQFRGIVDEIAPTSNTSDIVFSVSDKRQVQSFDIKARFDVSAYPQLKNGMSARMWVYQQ